MPASAEFLCIIFDGKNIRTSADHCCPESDDGLCSECTIHHANYKRIKSHGVISIENVKKLPQNILSISHHCKEHDKVYTNYCPDHECVCCPVCVVNKHNKCKSISLIDDIVKTAKSSSVLVSIQERIEALQQKLTKIHIQQDLNLLHNQQQREHFLTEIKKMRKSKDTLFDELEIHITQEISTAETEIKLDIEKLSDELKEKEKTLEKLEVDISSVKQYGSDLQTYIDCMTFKTKVKQVEKYLTSLQEQGKLKMMFIKCNINEKFIISMTTTFKSFGTISVDELEFDIDHKRALIISRASEPVLKTTDDINVTLEKKLEVPRGKDLISISGCTVRPDGKIIVVDRFFNHRVLILREGGWLEKEIKFPPRSGPLDVTSVDDRTICVSFSDNRLELIDTNTHMTRQVIKTNNACCGVTSHNGNLIWYEQWTGIQMKEKSSDIITTLVKDDNGYFWSCLTVCDSKIYQTIKDNHTVICYSIKGEKVWEFKSKTIITRPTGITIDNNGNIFVALLENKIGILSPDGKDFRQLLGKDKRTDALDAIYFDKSRNCLLRAHISGQVWIYNVF